jgi:chromosome segregation ATPase
MKTRFVMSCLVAGTVFMTSCTKKVDEKTMAEINTFGTEWTALGDKATAWSQELNTSVMNAKTFAAKQQEMMTSMSDKMAKDPAMKATMENSVKMANEDVARYEAMAAEWNSFKATFDETTKSYNEWKEKVSKGEVSADDANKGLADFRTKLTDAQTKVDNWGTAYAELKSSSDRNMVSAEEMMKSMDDASKK